MTIAQVGVASNSSTRAMGATGLVRQFNEEGVLDSADIHIAQRLARLTGENNETVVVAAALAVQATRRGSVCVDLFAATDVAAELGIDASALSWPAPVPWLAAVAASRLTAGANSPLVLDGSLLYLDRYHRYESGLADDLKSRRSLSGRNGRPGDHSHRSAQVIEEELLKGGLDRLFPPTNEPDFQRHAADVAVRQHLSVIAGGPGTGKTTTLARVIALLLNQRTASGRVPMIALAAPTGRAAARLKEAIGAQVAELPIEAETKQQMMGLNAVTLHRLLGWQPRNRSRFKHNAKNPLPFDVVIVDESSMISLSMMAQLVDAVRHDARLILVGDPRQLASVDAGSVFGDIVGPITAVDAEAGIVVLQKIHRFGGVIGGLAANVLGGAVEDVIATLERGLPELKWVQTADGERRSPGKELAAGALVLPYWLELIDAAAVDEVTALAALGGCRILCAHREGPFGAAHWNRLSLVAVARSRSIGRGLDSWFAGRPLLAVENDYQLGVFNGDSGVVLESPTGGIAVFDRSEGSLRISPERLGPVQTGYAATVHRSQGSQFDTVLIVLPPPESRALSREMLYTAITRAKKQVIIYGSAESLAAAINRQATRRSGLRSRLWPPQQAAAGGAERSQSTTTRREGPL